MESIPLNPDSELSDRLNPEGLPVLGFIGSLYRYEGVSWLVRAVAELRRRGSAFKLIILGRGEDAAAIRQAIQETGSDGYVLYLGQVAHDQVQRYYSIIDIVVYPRHSIRLTELVTPLKPLEAMAQGKAVMGSSVGGIRELVEDERTGLLFEPGNIDHFCRQARRLIADSALRRKLAEQGRTFVLEQKGWSVISARYSRVYDFASHAAKLRT